MITNTQNHFFAETFIGQFPKEMNKTGLAFSGGGVRSAALSSGVLRRLLHKKITPDYLSCVSGGGYTGTAYLDWKYRNEQKDDPGWHKEFFDNMKTNIGLFCNWRNPLKGIFDTFILLTVILFVSVVLSCVNWSGLTFPTAYIIDYFFGDIMRKPFTCPDEKTKNFSSSEIADNTNVAALSNMTNQVECVPTFGPDVYITFITFAILFLLFLLFYVVNKVAGPLLKPFANVLYNLSGFTFAMVFLPWFIEEYIVVTPLWLNALIIVLSILLWMGIAPLRDKASMALIVYLYAYGVKWRVYKTEVLSIEYSEKRFTLLMWISAILIWLNPFVVMLQMNAIHTYNRYSLIRLYNADAGIGNSIICSDIWLKYHE